MTNLLAQFKNIDTFILDLDGVLTDGNVLISESGEQLRTMNIKDGYAIQLALKNGYRICVISGGKSETVLARLHGLGVKDIFLGVSDKSEILSKYLKVHNLNYLQVLYMGDDIPDIPAMKKVAVSACPSDAADEVRMMAHYTSDKKGGRGCVRDVIEKVMRIRQNWSNVESLTTQST